MALKITLSKSGAAAEKYFNAHLKASDYLSEDGARPGIWFGEGAKRLGLKGEVAAKDFLALADNKDPNTGERLTVRDVKNARPGYDFTFSGPKSFAAMWARTGDGRLIEALRGSILDTIRLDIEPEMKTRLRRDGQDSDVVTGNLVGSLFLHDTTRPLLEDNKPDPHPHGHAYIFNRTWAPHEKRWQAAQLGDLHLDRPYLEAAFQARLAAKVKQLGYAVERDGKGSWEIVGVPQSVNVKFSRRTFQEIEPEARRRGITDDKVKSKLGLLTRQEKGDGDTLATPELHAYWNGRLTADEASALDSVAAKTQAGSTGGGARVTAEQAVRHSLEHFFGPDGRNSAESEKAVLEEALRYGAGSVLPEEAKKELARQDLIRAEIGGRMVCTTAEVYAEEQALKQSAWAGRHACAALSAEKPYVPQAAMAAARLRKEKLDGEQAEAVRHLLDSEDRTQILIGKAGTGKTTTLQELDRALRERGRKLMAFAPTARASRGVLRKKGFAAADTLANLLDKPQLQAQVRGQVILIDEAGLAGTRALRQVLDLVDRHRPQEYDTRVILVGDPLQHSGVPRGQVLTILQEQAGLTPVRLSTIRRQKEPGYRHAVELLSVGKAGEAFDRLDDLGFIREVADPEERYRMMAKDYADCHAAGDSEMIISPTHAEGRAVAAAVRAELKTRKLLGEEDRTLLRLENKDRSIAQRKDAASYGIGDTIQWNQNAPGGFGRGDRVKVVGRDGDRVLVEDKRGQVRELPLTLAERFELYRSESLAVADGERLRITRNGYAFTPDGKQHALNNGDVVTVRFTKQGDLIDQRGWIIPATFGHLASGVVTSVASQGMDDNVPFLAQSAASRGAASAEQFYVSVSRGIKSLHLYTDDKEALRSAVVRSSQARTAAEVFEASQRQQKAETEGRRKAWWQRQRVRMAAALRQQAVRRQQQQINQAIQHRPEQRGLGHAQ